MSTEQRTQKATETRIRKRQAMRDTLFQSVSSLTTPLTDWQIAYENDLPLPAVRLTFETDARFLELMRTGKIAVPARTLKYSKWAAQLTDAERAALPTVSNESKLSADLLPVSVTGDSAFDGDITALEADALDSAKRLTPRKARSRLDDQAMTFSRLIAQNAQKEAELKSARIVIPHLEAENKQKTRALAVADQKLALAEQKLALAEQKLARLDHDSPPPPPPQAGDEARPH